jgi:hypothetical protein
MHTSSTNKLSYKQGMASQENKTIEMWEQKEFNASNFSFKLKLHYLVSLNLASWALNKL